MKSIPRLVGDAIPSTDNDRSNKVLLIIKNPDDVENNRPIESILPENLAQWLGIVVISNRNPQQDDLQDAVGNKYVLGSTWINNSTTPNLIFKLTSKTSTVATWTKQANTESPNLTGTPTAPDSTLSDSSTKIANDKFVQQAQRAVKAQLTMAIEGDANFDGTNFYFNRNIYLIGDKSIFPQGYITINQLTAGTIIQGLNGTTPVAVITDPNPDAGHTVGTGFPINNNQLVIYRFNKDNSTGTFYILDVNKFNENTLGINDYIFLTRIGDVITLGNGLPLTPDVEIIGGSYSFARFTRNGSVSLFYNSVNPLEAGAIEVEINGKVYKVPCLDPDSPDQLIPVKCHTSCHSSCHSSCHGSCRSSW